VSPRKRRSHLASPTPGTTATGRRQPPRIKRADHTDRRQAQEVQAGRVRRCRKGKGLPKIYLTVVNKSDKPLDLGLTYVQSSNKEAEQVFDSENDLESTPDTKVLKGGSRSLTWDSVSPIPTM
jgi:hypothetical protein